MWRLEQSVTERRPEGRGIHTPTGCSALHGQLFGAVVEIIGRFTQTRPKTLCELSDSRADPERCDVHGNRQPL